MVDMRGHGVLVPKEEMLIPRLSVADHLTLFGWTRPFPFGLDPIRKVFVDHCTVGQRRRLMVTIGMSHPTEALLLLESPTEGMTDKYAQGFVETLATMSRARGITTLCVLDKPSAAVLNVFDRVWTVGDGNVALHLGVPFQTLSVGKVQIVSPPSEPRGVVYWIWKEFVRYFNERVSVARYLMVHLGFTALIAGVHACPLLLVDARRYREQWICLAYWWTLHPGLAMRVPRARCVEVSRYWLRNRWMCGRHYLASYAASTLCQEAIVSCVAVYLAYAILGYPVSPSGRFLYSCFLYRMLMWQAHQCLLHVETMLPRLVFGTTTYLSWALLNAATLMPFSEYETSPLYIRWYMLLNPLFWFWQSVESFELELGGRNQSQSTAEAQVIGGLEKNREPLIALTFMLLCGLTVQAFLVMDWDRCMQYRHATTQYAAL